MNRDRLLRLAERRARLVECAAREREALAGFVSRGDGTAQVALSLVDGVRRVLSELRNQPLLAAGLVGLVVALRPRRALGWMLKGWSAWRLVRGAQRWWRRASDAGFLGAR